MSTVPKAQKSDIAGLTVIPDEWNSYPNIDRSTIRNCTFTNLSDSTTIDRSSLSDTSITNEVSKFGEGSGNDAGSTTKTKRSKGAYIERSTIQLSQIISPSSIERSVLSACTVQPKSKIGRTTARSTKFVNAKFVERSELTNSYVLGQSVIERSTLVDSVIADNTRVERTETNSAVISRSRVERSKITDCDIKDCTIERTDFNGMILQYGIWKNGDLVGRTSNEHEVVIKPREKSPTSSDTLRGVVSKSMPTDTLSALEPVQDPGSGWKAAEAERERLGMQSDPDDEDSSTDELEDSNDDDVLPSSLQPVEDKKLKEEKKRSLNQQHPAFSSEHAADFKDPPPPYQQ